MRNDGGRKEGSGTPGTSTSRIGRELQLYDVLRLEPLWPLGDIELQTIALVERFESGGLNGRMVHEYILPGRTLDEPVAFIVVKPLYSSLFSHYFFSYSISAPRAVFTATVLESCSRNHSIRIGHKTKKAALHLSGVAAAVCHWGYKNLIRQ